MHSTYVYTDIYQGLKNFLCVCLCVRVCMQPPNNPAKLQRVGTSANIVFLVFLKIWSAVII